MRQSSLSLAIFLMCLSLASCASYQPTSAPIPKPASMQYKTASGGFKAGADVWADAEQQQAVFDANLQESNVIAVLVLAVNNTQRSVLVRPGDMILTLPNRQSFAPAEVDSVVAKVGEGGSVVGATLAFGLIGALMASSAQEESRSARTEDYDRKAFQLTKLDQGESAHGFVFFMPPKGSGDFDQAELSVKFDGANDKVSNRLRLTLRGLGYKETVEKPKKDEYAD